MADHYEVRELFHWTREGFSPRARHVVEHEGFDLTSYGFRIYRNGVAMFPSMLPFKTREGAEWEMGLHTGAPHSKLEA